MTLPAIWAPGATTYEEVNHVTNPLPRLFAAGLASGYTQEAGAAAYANSQVAGEQSLYAQRVQYTGAAGDVSAILKPLKTIHSAVGSAAPGDIWTAHCRLKGACVGLTSLLISVVYFTAADVYISENSSAPITLTGAYQECPVTGAAAPANTSRVGVRIVAYGVGAGDTIDMYAECFSLMEIAAPLAAFPDPTVPGAHFTGVWHNSVSHKELAYPSDGKWVVCDTKNAHNTTLYSPAVAVTGGQVYGAGALIEVTARTGGTFAVAVCWYDSGDNYLSGETTGDLTAITAEAWYASSFTAPTTATQARLRLSWTGATGACVATVRDAYLGQPLPALPNVFSLESQSGQFAAPLDLLIDGHTAELAACYVGHAASAAAVIEDFVMGCGGGAAWAKTGGGAATGTNVNDAAGWKTGAGSNVYRTCDAIGDTLPIDVTRYEPGEYLVLANVKYMGGATGVEIKQGLGEWTAVVAAALRLLPLGVVSLPTRAVRGTAAATLDVSIRGNGTNYAAVNYVALVPISDGIIGYMLASGHVHELRWEDGTLYADDVADLAHVFGGVAPLRTLGGALVVLAEQATAAPTTLAQLTATAQPRYEQFPSA